MVASKGRRTPRGGVPSHGGAVAVVRIAAQESGVQIRCSLHECGQEPARSFGAPVVRCFGSGKRACERGIGPPVKCGAFDMQKLAELRLTSEPLCPDGPVWPREGTLCGCWWAMRKVELSTARCVQVSFRNGRGCGLCIFDLPMSKADPQAMGKKRTHSCTCESDEVLCPVKVARKLHGSRRCTPSPGCGRCGLQHKENL